MSLEKTSMFLEVGLGIGVLMIGAGIALAVYNFNRSGPDNIFKIEQPQPQVNLYAGMPGRVIGRPYDDPYTNNRTYSVWGHDLWSHRHPRVRPVFRH
jgi:hypothetical protein